MNLSLKCENNQSRPECEFSRGQQFVSQSNENLIGGNKPFLGAARDNSPQGRISLISSSVLGL